MWNYADLTKMAKEMGGPEKFMAGLVQIGKQSGRIEGAVITGLGFAAVGLVGYGVKFVYDKFSNSDAKNAQIVDEYMNSSIHKTELETEIENIDSIECTNEGCNDNVDIAYLSDEIMPDGIIQTKEESEIQNQY